MTGNAQNPLDLDSTHKDLGLYVGHVQATDDPQKRGRVKVSIPGNIEPAIWAETVMPGSPFSNGVFAVPAVGSQVLVGFLQGDYTQPVVLGGIAPPVGGGYRSAETSENLPKYVTAENEDFIVMLGKEGTNAPFFSIASRSGDLSITLSKDGKNIEMFASTAVKLSADGLIELSAPLIKLGNRLVLQNGRPI